MKKKLILAILLILVAVLVCVFGFRTRVRGSEVTLIFVCDGKNIRAALTEEEAAKVIDILDGKPYDPMVLLSYPSCGFHRDIALMVGNRRFAIARDSCNGVQNLGNYLYFDISKEDMAYIHSIFEKYGGYFPCI